MRQEKNLPFPRVLPVNDTKTIDPLPGPQTSCLGSKGVGDDSMETPCRSRYKRPTSEEVKPKNRTLLPLPMSLPLPIRRLGYVVPWIVQVGHRVHRLKEDRNFVSTPRPLFRRRLYPIRKPPSPLFQPPSVYSVSRNGSE